LKLSTRGRYATRALLDLACHWGEGPVPLKDVARRQEISLNYLEHLITPLIIAGLMRSHRGPAGGVELARPPADIKLSEVIRLVEGSVEPVDCVGSPGLCSRSAGCVTRDVWVELERAVNSVLDSVTLADLVERQKKKGESL
jgi:Rrf2 family transcriptional regulator, cysteine metabolism repressor